MPTFTPRGFAQYVGSELIPGLRAWFNATAGYLETAFNFLEDAIKGWASVETVAELPTTGNWPGRLIYCEEDDRLRRWNGTQWGVIGFPPSIFTTPPLGAGWNTPSLNDIYQRSGWVQATFNAYRSSAGSFGTVIFEVPVGYGGDHNVFANAVLFDGDGDPIGTVLVWYDRTTEEMKLREPMAAGTSIAFSVMWPLEGAT